MRRRSWLKLLLAAALAVSTMAVIGSAAGAPEGRDGGAEPGPAVESPDAGGGGTIVDAGDWDGDGPAPRDQQILDDLIVDGSACIGLDCVNGESFGFDTLRLKENNLRIHFHDTSTSASFPSNDWRIVINDSSNGGGNYFGIEDTTAARNPFRIEAGARSNALYVEADGDIGVGTPNPTVDLHILTGNTPTVRLDQDGSSGFTAQTWDLAGNEANFFIRDATNGSTLPFRIRPGAPSSAIDIKGGSGDVGFGTDNPASDIHVRDTAGRVRLRLEDTSATTPGTWEIGTANNGDMVWSLVGSGGNEMAIQQDGDLVVSGQVFANGSATPLDDWFLGHIEELRAENAALRAELEALRGVVDGLTAAQN